MSIVIPRVDDGVLRLQSGFTSARPSHLSHSQALWLVVIPHTGNLSCLWDGIHCSNIPGCCSDTFLGRQQEVFTGSRSRNVQLAVVPTRRTQVESWASVAFRVLQPSVCVSVIAVLFSAAAGFYRAGSLGARPTLLSQPGLGPSMAELDR